MEENITRQSGTVPPVAVSMFLIFLYSLFSNIEYYFKKTGFIALASIVCAVANLGLNKVFIELFDIMRQVIQHWSVMDC